MQQDEHTGGNTGFYGDVSHDFYVNSHSCRSTDRQLAVAKIYNRSAKEQQLDLGAIFSRYTFVLLVLYTISIYSIRDFLCFQMKIHLANYRSIG